MEKKRILIADDEKGMRLLLAGALETYNYEIDLAEDGLEAISRINMRPYDLIITDYMMPRLDGLELTRKVRAKNPSTPIIVLTGEGPVRELLECGATACVKKPFDIGELQKMVRVILEKERYQRENKT